MAEETGYHREEGEAGEGELGREQRASGSRLLCGPGVAGSF